MSDLEHTTYLTWLDSELDGELAAPEKSRLASHLSGCPECQREQQTLV